MVYGAGPEPGGAFRWNRATRAVEYLTIAPGANSRDIFDANTDGPVGGGGAWTACGYHAFRSTSQGGTALVPHCRSTM